jgi:alanine racemase
MVSQANSHRQYSPTLSNDQMIRLSELSESDHLSTIDGGIYQRAWIEIDEGAIAHNIRQLKKLLASKTELMAVVKADGYGHGAVRVSQIVLEAGASWLAVATVPEGIELRQAGIQAPILILGAINQAAQIEAISYWQLQPTICNKEQALIFAKTLSVNHASLSVHLKIDTGMSRLGTPWQEAEEFIKLVQSLPQLNIASIYSHFATADSPDPTIMWEQNQRFLTALKNAGLEPEKNQQNHNIRFHIANSAGTLVDSALHYDLVRPGLAVYGLYPAPHLQDKVNLQPVMQVKARVTQVKNIKAGTGVSYGHRFVAPQDMLLAVVGIGYADGIPRLLSNQLQVMIRGQIIQQIGSITMDQLMLDVTNIPDLQVGEIVTLLGKDGDLVISADDWANTVGTISWEILCSFKHRLPRVGVNTSC